MKKPYIFPEEEAGLKYLLIMCVFLGVIVLLVSIVQFFVGPKSFDVAKGAYLQRDYERAHRIFIDLADKGNAAAQYNLGAMYDKGQGVQQDYVEAAKWYRKAAEQGNAMAQSDLGIMYLDGKGVSRNYPEAVQWLQKAAEQGIPEAQHHLGYCYYTGSGVSQDYTEAARWYRKAAGQGHADSQINLGMMYSKGEGVPQDYLWAHIWMNIGVSRYIVSAKVPDQSARDKIAVAYQNINHTKSMMTPAQIAEAERLAREWKPKTVSGGKYLFQPRIDPSPLTGLTQTFPPRDLFLLAFQLASLALTYLFCRHLTLRWDTTRHKNFLLVSERDPFDIAFLRGGGSEVLTLSIFNLIRRGYLEIIVKPGEVIRCGRTASAPRSGTLSELEHKLYDWFSTPRNAEQIHRLIIKLKNRWGHLKTWECSCGIKNKEGVKICSGCGSTLMASTMIATGEPEKKVLETQNTYAERLAMERFLMPKEARDNTTYFIALLFFAIISVGVIGYLNISVSVFLGILLFGIGFIAIRSGCAAPYLTKMGENCLEESIEKYSWCKEPHARGPLSGEDESILFPVALFGIDILYHTKYSFFPKMFYYRAAQKDFHPGGRIVNDPETGAFVPDETHVVAENTPEMRITGRSPAE